MTTSHSPLGTGSPQRGNPLLDYEPQALFDTRRYVMSMLRSRSVAPVRTHHAHGAMSRSDTAAPDDESPTVTTVYPQADWRLWLALAVSLLALGGAIVDFALVIGAVSIPVPGLRSQGPATVADTATYSFENNANGWATRGAATNAVVSDAHVFAGRQALALQVANLSGTRKAFVYTTLPANARHHTQIIAHLYVPAGAPPLLATAYVLDKSWKWYSGPFPVLTPGQWTAVTYAIPAQAQLPIGELGLMFLTGKGVRHYAGPLYLDSVDVQHADR